jgi:hypothetical protein
MGLTGVALVLVPTNKIAKHHSIEVEFIQKHDIESNLSHFRLSEQV